MILLVLVQKRIRGCWLLFSCKNAPSAKGAQPSLFVSCIRCGTSILPSGLSWCDRSNPRSAANTFGLICKERIQCQEVCQEYTAVVWSSVKRYLLSSHKQPLKVDLKELLETWLVNTPVATSYDNMPAPADQMQGRVTLDFGIIILPTKYWLFSPQKIDKWNCNCMAKPSSRHPAKEHNLYRQKCSKSPV